jgi:transcriptional regulator with XRE-family HTH domain
VLEQGWTLQQAAEAAGCSVRTAAKWVRRFLDGDRALLDRSSCLRRSPTRLPQQRVQAIERLRRLRMTGAEIAEILQQSSLAGSPLGAPATAWSGTATASTDHTSAEARDASRA